MSKSKEKPLNFLSLYQDLAEDVTSLFASNEGTDLSILDFQKTEVNLGIDLTLQQELVLKVLYGLELTDEDVSILEYWKAKAQTNWKEEIDNPSMLILEAGRRCLDGNTLLFTDKGLCTLIELDMPVEEDKWEPVEFKVVQQDSNYQSATRAIYSGDQLIITVTTELGFQITGTRNHKLKVEGGVWKPIQKLEKKDSLVIVRGANKFPLEPALPLFKDKPVSTDFAFLLGLIQSRAISSDLPRFVMSTNEHYEATLRPLVSKFITSKFNYRNTTKDGKPLFIRFGSKDLHTFLLQEGLKHNSKQGLQFVPRFVRCGSREIQIAYLRGVFFSISRLDNFQIHLKAASQDFLQAIQLMLLNLDIVSLRKNFKHTGIKYLKAPELILYESYSLMLFFKEIAYDMPHLLGCFANFIPNIPKPNSVFLDKVKLKDKSDYTLHQVFDIEVPVNHEFIANGIISHNSGKCISYNSCFFTKQGLIYPHEFICKEKLEINQSNIIAAKAGEFYFNKLLEERNIKPDSWTIIKETVALANNSTAEATGFYNKGHSTVIQLTTKAGYTITGTPEHRVKVRGNTDTLEWRLFKDIKLEDEIGIATEINIFPDKQIDCSLYFKDYPDMSSVYFNEEWAYLLGLAVSNKLLDTGFDELFTNLGWDAKLPSYKRTTPWVIRMSPRTVVESYLVGLQDGIFFDADFKSCLAASKCEHFIVETQLLYLNLGVITLKEKVGGYYTLHKQLTGDAIYFDPVTLIEHSKTHCIDLSVPEHEQYVAQGMINHNSTLASLIATYEFYALTKLEQPQAMYGIANSTPIGILVLATTAEQAKKTIFRQVLGILKNSKYFQRLEETGKLFIGKEEVAMESKNLYLYSGNSRSAGQVGGTLKCLIMDEVARFSDIDGDSNALTLWSNLGISCAPFKETAKLIAISSAWCEGDAIQTLFDRAMSGTNSFALKAKSWELNPIHAARDNPVVASFYETNPVEAAVEFEGIRPASSDPFLTASEISKAFNTKSVIHAKKVLNDVTGLVELEIIHFPYVGTPCYLHIDPAITKDSYALAFAHGEDIDGKLVVLVDGILAWEPDYKHSVSITNVQTLIKEINLRMPIEKVTADHYNSAETLERLRLEGIKAEQVYFSNREQILMYDNLRQLLHEERIKFPKDSPWSAMLERELKQVQLINGRKIDHPAKGSKDLADAVAAVAYSITFTEVRRTLGNTNNVNVIVPANENRMVMPSRRQVLNSLDYRRSWSKNILNNKNKY